ncbi:MULTISPECIES: CRISPR-associated helicase/endonuclease Cas3 [unclassified Thioalkalivibrio]|uniref:CRISPR-associated helicase/endonuclease Cas3 n=1 Tax=unclassified Thioalkalivibrio TaxID=2621013 RepID=UPI0009D96C20|nr:MULTISPECIES: CRISPR-associated helicase/endonuclease Cas3 [unclassified Thioalkalivibrio]
MEQRPDKAGSPEAYVQGFFRYWGKADGKRSTDDPCHLLPFHSLDVAAVGQALLEGAPIRTRQLANSLRMDTETLVSFFVYSLALHDLGKFARSFQGLARPQVPFLVQPAALPYNERHDSLGAQAWYEKLLIPRLNDRQQAGASRLDLMDEEDALRLWMGCFFGHHGKPVQGGSAPLSAAFLEEDLRALEAFSRAAEGLLQPAWPSELLGDEAWRKEALAPASWQIAGLAVLADWLGSNADIFAYQAEPVPLQQYWNETALPRAHQALAETGLLHRPGPVSYPGFTSAFGFQPTPLQAWAETAPLAEGPQLFLLEDITGAGKTEAALTLAHRLLAERQHEGLYFGLPTMATSNAMYRRLGGYYRRLYPPDTEPSLILAHGARDLNEAFRQSVVLSTSDDAPYTRNEDSAGSACRAWLADNRKKALLAEVGVGTIDQALLAVLPRKHQPLRLLGLAGKVLIVDEVHAYDTYTSGLLKALLDAHARQGGSAILLSATMPRVLREDLVGAWQQSRGENTAGTLNNDSFPLATHVRGAEVDETPLAASPFSGRNLPVEFVHTTEEALDIVVGAAREGRCACWIRNTVDDAIAAYQQVSEQLTSPEQAMLFHARFTMADRQRIENAALQRFGCDSAAADRQGQVLVATQVVEQSLDLDFDVLVTDLAPIDLVIQRAGRLHRHRRDTRGNRVDHTHAGEDRPAPALHVLAPEWTDTPNPNWLPPLLRGTGYVYPDTAQLWNTCRILREEGAIRLPERARVLLEAVHGGTRVLPEGLEDTHYGHYADQNVARSVARFNALRPEQGYQIPLDGAGWDDDQELGTRLSNEKTISVALVKETDGHLLPMHEHERHPWAMSTVQLRESQARRLPPLPQALESEADLLREMHRFLRGTVFWLPDEEDASRYDTTLGAIIARGSGRGESV